MKTAEKEILYVETLNKKEIEDINNLERSCGFKRGLYYKLDPQTLLEKAAGAHHLLCYIGGILAGYATLTAFDEDETDCTVIAGEDKGLLQDMQRAVFDKVKEKGYKKLLYIVDEKDCFTANFIKANGAQYVFSEYRMNYNTKKAAHFEKEPIELEDAAHCDAAAVAALDLASFNGAQQETPKPGNALQSEECEVEEAAATADITNVKLAKIGGKVVGKIRIEVAGGAAGLYGFAVNPIYRRQGYGRKILNAAIKKTLENGTSKVYLEVDSVNEAAVKLYKTSGFEMQNKFDYYTFPCK